MVVLLKPHQLTALEKMHNGSILTGGVGSGKTITSVAYFTSVVCGGGEPFDGVSELTEFTRPTDVIVITTAKQRDSKDWERQFAGFRLSRDRSASWGGVQATVDSWNNIGKYVDVKDAFFIFDEQRLVGSGAWVKSFLKIAKANQWIMLSATPGDTWLDYAPVFIANGFYKNITEFKRTHVVYNSFAKYPKVDRYVETGRLKKHLLAITVDMPYERHTTRHVRFVPVAYDEEKYELVTKKRWNPYKEEPIKDVSELFVNMRRVVNEDVSRIGAIMRVLELHPKLIIFYNFNYELEILRTLQASLDIPMAEWNGHKHEQIPEGDRWIYLVQYTAGSEGWNCVTTNAIAFWSLNYSYKIFEQSKGRIDRLNTPYKDLYYYVLRSTAPIDRGIMKSLNSKENFNEQRYAGAFARSKQKS